MSTTQELHKRTEALNEIRKTALESYEDVDEQHEAMTNAMDNIVDLCTEALTESTHRHDWRKNDKGDLVCECGDVKGLNL